MSSALVVPGAIKGGKAPFRSGYADPFTATVKTGGSATGGLLVDAAAGDRVVDVAAEDSVVCVGYATHDAAAGEKLTVATDGVWPCTADGAVTAGSRLAVGAGGKVKEIGATVGTGGADSRGIVGIAESDAADAAVVRVRLTL